MRRLRIGMAQINPVVGDLRRNSQKVLSYCSEAKRSGCDLVLFPELALTGYPPEDLLLKPKFIEDNIESLEALASKVRGITAVVGFVDRGDDIYNAAAIIHSGRVAGVYHKMHLPNYGVFDEQRYFQSGERPLNFRLNGITIGLEICEDIWFPEGPARAQALAGAEVIVNINASPYHMGKGRIREEMLSTRALDNGVIIAYNNMVGGQDELVFDGQGLIVDEKGTVMTRGAAFREDLIVADLNLESAAIARLHDPRRRGLKSLKAQAVTEVTLKPERRPAGRKRVAPRKVEEMTEAREVLEALVLGTSDYVRKNGFKHAVVGLSGGIDSSLVASIAVLALGSDSVTGVAMPSKYSSTHSMEDSEELARSLKIPLLRIPIKETFKAYTATFSEVFKGLKEDITEENLQARIRGNFLMALSNKFGWLVLTTGNKSEMSVGYATLYGDMAGGFAVIKDVPKTLVYEVAKEANRALGRPAIPERVFTKAPSAELRPGQTDQDTLPPYDVLDRILKAYVEDDRSVDEIALMGFKKALVRRVIRMVDLSEYKRRQAPPGVKITPRALGKDRRMPITSRYTHE